MKYRTTYDAIGEAKAVDGVIDVSPDVAAVLCLGEPIEEAAPTPDPQADAIAALLGAPAADVIPKIAEVPADKADVLKAVREAEAGDKGKKRKTVLDAIDARLAEIAPKE